jgi:GNAT superfamily N-acetyltransferase
MMQAFTYVAASQLALGNVVHAFNRGFTGYYLPLTQTDESLRAMVLAYDISLEHSLVALDAAGEPVGLALLALRASHGWVGAMGIAPEWRQRGQGAALMAALIAHCRALSLEALELEVLEQNAPAHQLYRTLGFVETRPLRVYTGPLSVPAAGTTGEAIHPLNARDALAYFTAWHPAPAPWQRDLPSLAHAADRLSALGLWEGPALAAYLLFGMGVGGLAIQDAASGAATPGARSEQVARLIRAAVAGSPSVTLRAVNVPAGDALGDALEALGCPVALRQREMTLDLRTPR